MESIDITRLLDDSFLTDDDLIESGIKHALYQRACYQTEHHFKALGFNPAPCQLAQEMIIRYNKLISHYEQSRTHNTN